MSEKIEANILNLVMSFYFACWQQLGKVVNPVTNKIEKNLEQAKYSIDMLIILRDKTKGNLSSEEEKTLQEAIANLQLNYVDELKNSKNAEEKKEQA